MKNWSDKKLLAFAKKNALHSSLASQVLKKHGGNPADVYAKSSKELAAILASTPKK